jgi:hypothetical protein
MAMGRKRPQLESWEDTHRIRAPPVRYKRKSMEERDAAVDRLRDFLRLSYMLTTEAARRIEVRYSSLCLG